MASTDNNRKPVKRTLTKSSKVVSRTSNKTTPTRRTDVVRPKAATKNKRLSQKKATQSTRKQASRATARPSTRTARRKPATKTDRREDFVQRLTSSRVAIVLIGVVAVFVLVGAFDMAANWGKAYGNVSINGINVGGMTSEQIVNTLKDEYEQRITHAQVKIYANEEAQRTGGQSISQEELEATAEEISLEEAQAQVQSWDADALTLKGYLPYEDVAEQAIALGRDNGGFGKRLGLLVGSENIDMGMKFNDGLVDQLAGEIDLTIGDPRVDTTVVSLNGTAEPVEGHSGMLVDRKWLAQKLSDSMMSGESPSSFVAEAVEAQSRISMEQANNMANAINQAIRNGVNFNYSGKTWLADATALSEWTEVNIVGEEGNWKLEPVINESLAVPAVVSNAQAEITAEDMTVTFEVNGSDVYIHTQGSGNIPEVSTAVADLQNLLYGENGLAWGNGTAETPSIEITESDRPETLSFDDALNMGVISVIGEYTTEFSNYEGTENRNHNIKLAADIFNNGVIEAQGGLWYFNDRSGDTNEEAGFWTAGSIVSGEYVDSVGGGICQVATTVFNAVLESGLEVTERHNHTLYIASYPTGRDAAVDYPSDLDLGWKNSLASDILMKTSYTDTSITVQLYSVRTGYKADFELGEWEEGAKYATTFEYDSSLGEGVYYRKTVGSDGSKITLTRYVSDKDGNNVRTDSFQSVYSAKNEVYLVGDNVDTSKLTQS